MDEVDLYEDIFLPVVLGARKDSEEVNDHAHDDRPVDVSSAEVLKLKEISSQLTVQNTALKKNISCLYKTAQQELKRKESLIERLVKRVKWLERNSDAPISPPTKIKLNNGQLTHVQAEVVKNLEMQRIRRDETRTETHPTSEKICRQKNDKENSDDHIEKRGLPAITRRRVPNHVTESAARADEDTPHATDRQRRKRLLTSGEHKEAKRLKDVIPSREGRPRGTPPAPQTLTRSRSRDVHQECRRRERRQHYSQQQKENRDDVRLGRRRKRSPSPPQPCDGGDLRKILKRKRSRLEHTPKTDRTSKDISPTEGSCPPTPSYGELIEDELLELEFDEPYSSSAELSCLSPSEDHEQIRMNNEVESVTSDSAENRDTKTNQNGGFDTDVAVQSTLVDEETNDKLATDIADTGGYDRKSEDETHDEIDGTVCKETNTDELENPWTPSDSEEMLEDGEIDDPAEITKRDSPMNPRTPSDSEEVLEDGEIDDPAEKSDSEEVLEDGEIDDPAEKSDSEEVLEDGEIDDSAEIAKRDSPKDHETKKKYKTPQETRKVTRQSREHNKSRPSPLEPSHRPNRHSPPPRRQEHRSRDCSSRNRRNRDDMRSSKHGDSDVYSRRKRNKQ